MYVNNISKITSVICGICIDNMGQLCAVKSTDTVSRFGYQHFILPYHFDDLFIRVIILCLLYFDKAKTGPR